MPFVWSIGTIIGPAIGGTFANPSVAFPWLFSPSGIFSMFPYLLPNLICAALLLKHPSGLLHVDGNSSGYAAMEHARGSRQHYR